MAQRTHRRPLGDHRTQEWILLQMPADDPGGGVQVKPPGDHLRRLLERAGLAGRWPFSEDHRDALRGDVECHLSRSTAKGQQATVGESSLGCHGNLAAWDGVTDHAIAHGSDIEATRRDQVNAPHGPCLPEEATALPVHLHLARLTGGAALTGRDTVNLNVDQCDAGSPPDPRRPQTSDRHERGTTLDHGGTNMAVDLRGRSLYSLVEETPDEIRYLLELAAGLKAAKKAGTEERHLVGKNIALIFEKTSTRTRSAFEVAAHDQ